MIKHYRQRYLALRGEVEQEIVALMELRNMSVVDLRVDLSSDERQWRDSPIYIWRYDDDMDTLYHLTDVKQVEIVNGRISVLASNTSDYKYSKMSPNELGFCSWIEILEGVAQKIGVAPTKVH